MFSLDGGPEYQKIALGLKALQHARPIFPAAAAESVRAALATAFPEAAPPEGEALLKPRYRGKEAKVLQLFGGRRGSDLPASLLREVWSQAPFLSPEGFACYLPAFLLCALGPDSRRDYLHSILFMLHPDWVALHQDPDGLHAEDAALTPAQLGAVGAFLALVIDAPAAMRWQTAAELPYGMAERELAGAALAHCFMAAQSARWRYRGAGPAADKAAAIYRSLTETDIPEPVDSPAAAVAARVRRAFDRTPPPGPGDMTDSSIGEEPFEYAVEFRGHDWRRLSAEFLAQNSAALSFFSHAAFRYYLPAYLLHHLAGVQSNADPVFALTHGFGPDDRESDSTYDWETVARSRFSAFTLEERAAVADFLRHELAASPRGDERIQAALENYWSR
jgi:hypothetical protein